ncbi:MAG: tRNA lysidine(34) synthetase TilS [Geminicoccaceae bacterium]
MAVSGGPDSSALALLARAWAAERGGTIVALIVDHGLRPEAAGEAAGVAERLADRGIPTRILAWHGPKPATGIMAAAREARLALLAEACREQNILHLLLAHQREDQAETVAMRCERGSGPAGRAGMATVLELRGLRILRPLLSIPKARLIATLDAVEWPWVEDPTNRDPRFRRARLRQTGGLDVDALWQESADRARARQAQDDRIALLIAKAVRPHRLGFASVDLSAWQRLPPDGRAAVLARLLTSIGGRPYPVGGASLDAAATRAGHTNVTLGGCIMLTRPGRFLVCREAARIAERADLAGGDRVRWDGRWELQVSRAPARLQIRALGLQGRAALPAKLRAALRRARIPAAALESLPAAWVGDRLLTCPPLETADTGNGDVSIAAAFRPSYPLTVARFAGVNVVSNPQSPIYRR